MSNKTNFRRAKLSKKRQENFVLKQSITDMVIPKYNALRDPYLTGFFDQPHFKSHLKRTGILSKKRGLSVKDYNEVMKDPRFAQRVLKHRSARSEGKGGKNEKTESIFPNIDQVQTEERVEVKTSEGTRGKKIYRSVKKKSMEL